MLLGRESVCSNRISHTQSTQEPRNRLSQMLSPSVGMSSSLEPLTQSQSASIIPGISTSNRTAKGSTPGVFDAPLESESQGLNGMQPPLYREDGVLQSSGLPAERRLTSKSISNPGYQCTTPKTGSFRPESSTGPDELRLSDRNRIFPFSQPPISGQFQCPISRPLHQGAGTPLEPDLMSGIENDTTSNNEERHVPRVSESPVKRRFTLDDQVLAEQEGRLKIGSFAPNSQSLHCRSQRTTNYTTSRSPPTQSQYSPWLPQPKQNIHRSETRELAGASAFLAADSDHRLIDGQLRRFQAESSANITTHSLSSPTKIFGQSVIAGGTAGVEQVQNRVHNARDTNTQGPRVQELDSSYNPGSTQLTEWMPGRGDRDSPNANADGVPDTFWHR